MEIWPFITNNRREGRSIIIPFHMKQEIGNAKERALFDRLYLGRVAESTTDPLLYVYQ